MINKKFFTKKAAAGGFTLIETLVATLLLSIAISGPLTIAQKGLQASLIAKDQNSAFFLAQDAVEYVRWVRDTNKLRGLSWLSGLDGTANGHTNGVATAGGNCVSASVFGGSGALSCLIDSYADTTASCGAATCSTLLNYDRGTNHFTNGSVAGNVVTSIFTRTVSITTPVCDSTNTLCNAHEASLTVQVTWKDPAQHTVTVEEELFDWQ